MAYVLMWGLGLVISLGLLSFLFAAIYKILLNKSIAWGGDGPRGHTPSSDPIQPPRKDHHCDGL